MALTDSLISHWKLDEASGTRADSHGSNSLSDNNTVGVATGKLGNAADFELSSTEYLEISDNASISVGDIDFTWAGWIQLESKAETMYAWSQYVSSGNQRSHSLRYNKVADRLEFHYSHDGSTTSEITDTNIGSPSLATWYFVVYWHDATSNTVNIQINNGTANSKSHSTGIFDSSAVFRIGGRGDSGYWDGLVDSVSFWKRVLTSDEKTALYNSGAGFEYPFTAPSTAYNQIVRRGDQRFVLGPRLAF